MSELVVLLVLVEGDDGDGVVDLEAVGQGRVVHDHDVAQLHALEDAQVLDVDLN